MTIHQTLTEKIQPWLLLNNPFYQAWSMGSLPTSALQSYASEYGNFLILLANGWQTLDDQETAAEEADHVTLWARFARSLQTDIVPPQLPATDKLVKQAQQFFAHPASAMGAMYAFEVQQPATASSKLEGLHTHYPHLHADETYFVAHQANQNESMKLLSMIEKLSPTEQQQAIQACAAMSQLLWETLTAIHLQTLN